MRHSIRSSRVAQRLEKIVQINSLDLDENKKENLPRGIFKMYPNAVFYLLNNYLKLLNPALQYFNPLTRNLPKQLLSAGFRNKNARNYYLIISTVAFIVAIGVSVAVFRVLVILYSSYFMAIILAIGVFILIFYLPEFLLRNRIKNRRTVVQRDWQDFLDLMVICVESGLSVEASMRRIVTELSVSAPVLASEIALTLAEMSIMPDRRRAYANLANRVDSRTVRATTVVLIQADSHGATISQSLRNISSTNREIRLANMERKYSALGPKMTIPLVVFFLPVLIAIIIGPTVIDVVNL
jgi:tight adherence protein C